MPKLFEPAVISPPIPNLPTILDFLKVQRRVISTNDLDELIYRICAHTGLSYDASKEVLCLYFEEFINTILEEHRANLTFGYFVLDPQTCQITFNNSNQLLKEKTL